MGRINGLKINEGYFEIGNPFPAGIMFLSTVKQCRYLVGHISGVVNIAHRQAF
jgi:hypothetical protein